MTTFSVLQALETILSVQDHIEVVRNGSGRQRRGRTVITHQPDLVLMDIRWRPTTGIEAAETILKDFPDAKIFVLTTFQDDEYITKALSLAAEDIY